MTPKVLTHLPRHATLDQQIHMVQQTLLRRRASSHLHIAVFRSQLKASITSPLVLLVATGLGFTIAQSTLTKAAQSNTNPSPQHPDLKLLPTLVSIISLTGSMMTLWKRFKGRADCRV